MKKRWLLLGAISLVQCGSGSSLRARSAGDMHCSEEELKIYQLDDRSYRVVGCGQESVYIEVCARETSVNPDCTWHLDSKDAQGPVPVQVVSAPAAGGCSYDNQCKGDRICVKHQCVAPASDSTNAAEPAQ